MAYIFLRLTLGSCCLFLFSAGVWAQAPCDPWVARLVSVQGTVEVNRGGADQWVAASAQETFCSGDQVRVGGGSRAVLYLFNEATIRLGPHSTLRLDQVEAPRSLFMEMVEGVAHFFSRFPQSLRLGTPFVNGVVKGTEFVVRVDAVQTLVTVYEGRVAAANQSGEAEVASGQNLVARRGGAPLLTRMVHPRRAVHWALYYPAVLDLMALKSSHPALGPAVDAFRREAVATAYDALPDDAAGETQLLKAALDLSVGRVTVARDSLNLLLKNDPGSSAAHALLAVMAVVQNDSAQALELADKAVGLEDTAVARLARSYARQAVADLSGALADAKTAVELDSKNPLTWARLAELQLAMGALKAAEKAAAVAVGLDETLAHTQTVLGFAHLTRFETQAAATAFTRAAELDPAAPLPRLGLGLTRISEGALAQGRELMEIAVSLDPLNSLLRSYLGKAFFEEKRDPLAVNQYEMAKKLDPVDPTPWLYGAIQKQTTNRPVAALDDLQESVKRNDNRAVTRSRFLLDEDLAVRGADLARIYSDLGYEQRALYEGWAAVNADPGEAAGHRFLADAYRSLPNHEIARASELLQAQMLSPLNTNPLQPAASETDLQFLAGTTAGSAALGEYTPLFVRDRVGVQGSVLAGEHNTYVDEAVVTTQGGPGVASAGFLHYETDGFRDNQDQTRDIQNVFGQVRLDPALSVQAEFRNSEADKGDLFQRFDPENFNTVTRNEDEEQRLRIGIRYAPSPQTDTLASVTFTDSRADAITQTPFGEALGNSERSGYLAEVQQHWRGERLSCIAGGGYSSEDKQTYLFVPLPPPIPSSEGETHDDVYFANGYLYAHLRLPDSLLWSLGVALESSRGGLRDRERFTPKAGVTWNLTDDTTLRAAVVSKLARELRNEQTLEPTQVAGFNQFYQDSQGSEMVRYGAAIDHRFTKRLFGGVEGSRREIEDLYLDAAAGEAVTDNWYEDLGRAYLYWAPVEWLAGRIEYRYETFERSLMDPDIENIKDLETHYVPLGIQLFCPKGAIFGLTATYVDQEGEFVEYDAFAQPFVTEDRDSLWVTDLSIGYRLPKRFGLMSLEIRNLFNESFYYQDMDDAATEFYPQRTVFGKISFSF
jgi:tetratricopeptide (TPR) repeat protein